MVERRRSLDQRGRAGLRVHQQRRNDGRADKPSRHETLSGLSGCEARAQAAGGVSDRSLRIPQSEIRRITDWGIYLGVAASVVSGRLIAYLRPGAELIPERAEGFDQQSGLEHCN